MISYHKRPTPPREKKREYAKYFTPGFQTVDTNDHDRIAYGISHFVCAPGVFKDGYRIQANFLFADWIGFDFDDGEMTLSQAVENVFCDMQHVIGITMSHQTDPEWRDKFRVMIPLERRIDDLALYRHQIALGMKRWPCDEKCKDGARFFYPCREIVSVNRDGYLWEIDEKMPAPVDYGARAELRVKHGVIQPWVLSALRSVWPVHTRNDTCYRLGCALGILGYSPVDITDMILGSPTYKGMTAAPKKEIFDAVESGVKRGLSELPQNLTRKG